MNTITTEATYEEKIQRSTFKARAMFVGSSTKAETIIAQVKKEYATATHNCSAYIVGKNAEICFASDDGEPSGTAGKPILGVLKRHNLTFTAIVVTRYFGGIELGIRGLIDAYGGVAEKVILLCETQPVIDYFTYSVVVPYPLYDTFLYKVKFDGVTLATPEYSDVVKVTLQVSEFAEARLLVVLGEMENTIKWLRE